jgi:hypothetical protein
MKKFEERLLEIGPRYHIQIQTAICSYWAIRGTTGDAVELKAKLIDRIWNAPEGRNPKGTYLNDHYLNQCINSGCRKYGTHTPPTALEKIRNTVMRGYKK